MKYIDALLTPNDWSRSQKEPKKWEWVVVHWFLVAGQPARTARNWWESRKSGGRGYGAGHVAVGQEGALLCVPFDEVAYHVGTLDPTPWAKKNIGDWFNYRCLAIEMEHPSWTGEPTPGVLDLSIQVAVDMCYKFDISPNHIITHLDITGMLPHWKGLPCHRWYVDNPNKLSQFRSSVNLGVRERRVEEQRLRRAE